MKTMIVLSVMLTGGPETSLPLVVQAQAMAAKMFEAVGVDLRWCRREACPVDAIHVTLAREAPRTLPLRALGGARVFEGRSIEIYVTRVVDGQPRERARALLAHVLVHEITHLLQGCDRHSETGIMSARWDRKDVQAMVHRPLAFTAHDAELIAAGLTARLQP